MTQTYVKFLVRSDETPDAVYGWFGVYYQRLRSGEVVQTTPGGAEVKYYDWDVYAYIDHNGFVTGVSPRASHGKQLDARNKEYKRFYADKELMATIVKAVQPLFNKSLTMFAAHARVIFDRKRELLKQMNELDSYRDMIDDYEVFHRLRQETLEVGAPVDYLDLRLGELRALYGDSLNPTPTIVDDVRQDINDVKLGRETWERIVERCRREVDGG